MCLPLAPEGATADGATLEDVVEQRALVRDALTELARLPKRQRQAIVGTALDGRGRIEVAMSMGLSEGAVRQLVHRARARLRTVVTAVTPWPLARWLASGAGTGNGAELAAGAGVAGGSGVLGLKLGVVLASGAIATGVAAVDLHGRGTLAGHRAVARAEVDCPAAGLAAVDAISGLDRYPFWHAARAELLLRLGRPEEAVAAWQAALALDLPAAYAAVARRRIASCSP